ncbi:hypothetical protein V8F20_004156 [Naviculisporaceae sp. PSN 640]
MRSNVAASATALLGLLAQVSTAASCTSSNAYPIEDYISSGAGGGGGGGAGAQILLSYDIIDHAVDNAVKKRHPNIPPNRTPDAKFANVAYAVRRAASTSDGSVTCSTSETCLSVQKAPFCLDMMTGDFHDGTGTTGNALTGDYVLGDGRKGNLYNGPHPVPAGAQGADPTDTGSGAGAKETTAPAGNGNGNGGATPPAATGVPPGLVPQNAVHGREKAVGVVALGGLMALVGADML